MSQMSCRLLMSELLWYTCHDDGSDIITKDVAFLITVALLFYVHFHM